MTLPTPMVFVCVYAFLYDPFIPCHFFVADWLIPGGRKRLDFFGIEHLPLVEVFHHFSLYF